MKSSGVRNFSIAVICIAAGLSSRSAAAQGASAPCNLLTAAQVGTAVGASVGAPQVIGTTGCSWSAPHIIVSVSLWDASKWEQMKTPLPGAAKTSVAGLGDDAFLTTIGKPDKQFVTLSVKKGATAYVFKVYGVSAPRQASMENTLAADVLAKP
jgi:hypothetical protein